MMRIVFVLLTIHLHLLCFAQSDIYYTEETNDLKRFYLDEFYYLVDSSCQYKHYERVAGFNSATNTFDGVVKDFYLNGNTALEGNYVDGKKQGLFQKFHPNRTIMWRGSFENDHPIGVWQFFYPDGQPLFEVEYDLGELKIIAQWNRRGKQVIKKGNGNFSFKIPFFQFNKWGYSFYERSGRVRNGLPQGYWPIYFIDHDNNRYLAAEETYHIGILTAGYNLFDDEDYIISPFDILPSTHFLNAEKLILKGCNIDEHTGFTQYLASELNSFFNHEDALDVTDEFAYTVSINEQGQVKSKEILYPIEVSLSKKLELAIEQFQFYFPSFQDEEYTDDKLTINGEISNDEKGKIIFHSLRIKRTKEIGKD